MPTLKDIATHTGLSVSTVSHILNGRGKELRISAKTSQLVKDAARELHYQPNEAARSMVRGKTKIVSFLAPQVWPQFVAQHIEGIAMEAGKENLNLQITPWSLTGDYESAIDSVLQNRPLGIITQQTNVAQLELLCRKAHANKIPLVALDSGAKPLPELLRIASDEAQGTELIARHLAELGHHSVAVLSRNWDADDYRNEKDIRTNGFLAAAETAGININPQHIVPVELNWDSVKGAIAEIFSSIPDRPTAIYCISDPLAMWAIRALHELHLDIPGDVSVAGYAGVAMSEYSAPPLTTVKQPFRQIGQMALQKIQEAVRKKECLSGEIAMPVELLINPSTGYVKS